MGLNCGIVGLPNVGKSTIFNALTATAQAAAENYPFCTIEPNLAHVLVPDPRLGRFAALAGSARIVPAQVEFVDIAGLVRGASRGEGLGNKFLSHIREVDAVVHVLRCFEDGGVAHVEGSVDPLRDAEIVETELMLADLESLERRLEPLVKRARGGDKEAKHGIALAEQALDALRAGKPARVAASESGDSRKFNGLHLITAKPVMYVCNVEEQSAANGNAHSRAVAVWAGGHGAPCLTISAAIEAEIALMDDADAREAFLADLGLDEPGLHRVIRAGYELLGLITFFTNGPKEARAWTLRRGARAVEAAGTIHSDFARGFVRVEVITCTDYIALGGEQGAKDAGRMRVEGRDYVVKEGDIMHFRFNV